METNINYAAVGGFVICLVTAMVMAIIWLSSGFSIQHYTTYKVYMQESVSGLNIDSPVEFNGVDVGSVKSIDLDDHNPQLVALLLNVKSTTPVTQGTIATLQTRGVTGTTFIALKDKSENLTPIPILSGEDFPVIKTGPSLFMRLDTALSQLSDNLREVTVSIRSLLDKENQQNIKEILLNIQKVTGSLAANNERMDRILANTEKASRDFIPLVKTTANAMHMFEMQTLPATYQLVSNLDSITRSLVEVSAELRQNPSILIRGVQRQSNGPGE
jgi:phospholipid/cholesterol/gamma-HCH transport system substrate-binding protein